jgi:hypothetical protein
MPAIDLQNIDDFLIANHPYYDKMSWEDISMPLQNYHYAQRLFSKAKPDEQDGAMVKWDVQYDFDNNFAVTALHEADTFSRGNNLTQGNMYWSFVKDNYSYDIREILYNGSDVRILKWLDEKEHGLNNSFFSGMEKLMFGTGPTSPTQTKPPPASLLWWIQPYNTDSGYFNNASAYQFASGVTSDFLGGDPYGFSSVGTGGISSVTYKGWRNRCGTYTVFSEDDAIDTIVECMDKCEFTPAHAYSELVPTTQPDWELTYSRLKLARRISSSQNDNMKGNIDKWKNTVLIRGVPLQWIAAWSNQDFGCARTDGPVLGVNWKTWKFYTKSDLNMVKSKPMPDKDNHMGRNRFLDHSCQIVCKSRRSNFIVTYGGSGSITESN